MSLTCKMLQTMSNGKWITNKELAANFGWRFGGRIFNLKKYGVKFEKKKGEGYIEHWRILEIPENVHYKNRTKIKVITLSVLDRIYNFITN